MSCKCVFVEQLQRSERGCGRKSSYAIPAFLDVVFGMESSNPFKRRDNIPVGLSEPSIYNYDVMDVNDMFQERGMNKMSLALKGVRDSQFGLDARNLKFKAEACLVQLR